MQEHANDMSAPSVPTKDLTKPAEAKRQISPEGRKRMAEAARKRWADKKKPEEK